MGIGQIRVAPRRVTLKITLPREVIGVECYVGSPEGTIDACFLRPSEQIKKQLLGRTVTLGTHGVFMYLPS